MDVNSRVDHHGRPKLSSKTGPVLRLPAELVYHVLDEIASERNSELRQQSLAYCTLTCQAWLHYASKLFLANVDVDRWDVASCRWVTLSALLDAAEKSPRLQRYVTSISENLESLCMVTLEEVQKTLPNVHSLTIRSQRRPEHALAVRPLSTPIHTLELAGMRADAFAPSLLPFASVEHLRLVQPHGYTFGFSRPAPLAKKIRVRRVSFEDMGLGARDPFLVLQGLLDPSALRSVSLHHRDDACAWYHGDAILEGLDAFLGHAGQGITALSLDAAHFRRGDRAIPALKCCTNLESLTLTMPATPTISPTALDAACAAVLSDTSASLRRLRLVFTPAVFDAWPGIKGTSAVTTALQKCAMLQRVVFVGAVSGQLGDKARARIHAILPGRLRSRFDIEI
ncbi:hypothetical protein PsYK624_078310 [Phanerochaete sordida]|uniref:F-box domain-containing protein n=1 Tax=Phanerochaete sordida TaxID=48140 RepID=A0A9P3GBE4_9APHY|nr:hypothetical protein PsYK624_078310 [Phanerochaete sordida]